MPETARRSPSHAHRAQFVLAGDIGGTKSNLAILEVKHSPTGEELHIVRSQRYPSADRPSLNAIIREFLGDDHPHFTFAGFGVPGFLRDDKVKPTNLTWGVDAAEISQEFSIPHVHLLNDLAANAYGIAELRPSDFVTIQHGIHHAEGNRCIISPGTGLGEAGLFWDGKSHRVWACEGGHTDFAPRNALEIDLLLHLTKQFGRVSNERVASGQGIENIYKFLRETGRAKELPAVAKEMKTLDPGYVISKHAQASTCSLCSQTIEIFTDCLAAEAGNLALKAMATGGVYLGGGIPGKLLWKIKAASFPANFNDKGRLSSLMESMPIKVILNDQAALLGAARYALDSAPA